MQTICHSERIGSSFFQTQHTESLQLFPKKPRRHHKCPQGSSRSGQSPESRCPQCHLWRPCLAIRNPFMKSLSKSVFWAPFCLASPIVSVALYASQRNVFVLLRWHTSLLDSSGMCAQRNLVYMKVLMKALPQTQVGFSYLAVCRARYLNLNPIILPPFARNDRPCSCFLHFNWNGLTWNGLSQKWCYIYIYEIEPRPSWCSLDIIALVREDMLILVREDKNQREMTQINYPLT